MMTTQRPPHPLISDHWRTYHTPEVVAWADAHRREHWLPSGGVRLHIDVYTQPDPSAPAVIFNHGGGGYSRLFLPIARAMYQLGYTVLLPDQRGQGLSEGDRGDFTVGQHVANIVDVARWARQAHAGRLFMGGGSLGGGLTYYAAAAGAPVDTLVLHNLYHFGANGDGLALSRMAALEALPGARALAGALMDGLASALPGLTLPYGWLGAFEHMVDARDHSFYAKWKVDPYPIKRVSLRYIHSLMSTEPARPFADNPLPALVINQIRDRMVRPAVTRRNFEQLGGPKQYVEIDYGHWATGDAFVDEWSQIVHRFLQGVVA